MEQKAKSLVYRRLTYADFRHINKKSGEEEGGGGQSYIDVSAHDVTVENWIEFLGTPTGVGAEGRPRWTFPINSLGVQEKIDLTIAQRRAASVSITSQKIYSRAANRVPAWRPENSFPTDYDPMVDNLVVYIIKTDSEQFWAGWLLKDKAPKNWEITPELSVLFGGEQPHAGYIVFRRRTFFDTEFKDWPFYTRPKSASNQVLSADEYEEDLRDEDTSSKLPLREMVETTPGFFDRIVRIRTRNRVLVKALKELYDGRCQLTGENMTFRKRNGDLYSEVHHLIPLGESGSDSTANAIVVSPLIHRMLHYADVSPIVLADIRHDKLPISINGNKYEITWHPEHSNIVQASLSL